MDVSETLRQLEASLLTNTVRKDRARVAELLADEFREFGRSGIRRRKFSRSCRKRKRFVSR